MNNTNHILRHAQKQKEDDFYTLYTDVENELKYYKQHFQNKVILCNCGDDTDSNFWVYFYQHFQEFSLKKLIAVSYNKTGHGNLYVCEKDKDSLSLISNELKGNGDFRNQECIELLKEADIVITNPPFSLFRNLISRLAEMNKQFILWGNNNAITYKEIFPLIQRNKLWLGIKVNKTDIFSCPETMKFWDIPLTLKFNTGKKYCRVPACTVFTNLEVKRYKPRLILTKEYHAEDYSCFDNLPDIINVSRVKDIPKDYKGLMAVPLTVLKYNLEGYDIIDLLNRYTVFDTWKINADVKARKSHCTNINGKATYARIVIRQKS